MRPNLESTLISKVQVMALYGIHLNTQGREYIKFHVEIVRLGNRSSLR